MKQKQAILEFLNDNHGMINSLMCDAERKTFNGDIVSIIIRDIKKQQALELKQQNKK